MTDNTNDNIQYNGEDIQRYVSGQMPAEEMHAMERAALEDPFLADAIEGYQEIWDAKKENIQPHLEQLHHRLKRRIGQSDRKIVPAQSKWWQIAAIVILLAGTGGLVYTLIKISAGSGRSSIAKTKSTTTQDTLVEKPALEKYSTTADSTSTSFSDRSPEKESYAISPRRASPKPTMPEQSDPVTLNAAPEQESDSASLIDSKKDVAAFYKNEKPVSSDNTRAAAPAYGKEAPGKNFNGRVVSKNNKPVPGATVVTSGKEVISVATDSNGYFNFSLPDTTAAVAVNAAGFETTRTTINSNASNAIKLTKSEELKDVVASGYGARKKSRVQSETLDDNSQNAKPVIGWVEYNKYLEKNKRISTSPDNSHEDVVLSFFVNSNGNPGDIKIEKPVSKLLNQEAIRLVKEGPPWKLLKKGESRVVITIRF